VTPEAKIISQRSGRRSKDIGIPLATVAARSAYYAAQGQGGIDFHRGSIP
jgi:hypothetical protein